MKGMTAARAGHPRAAARHLRRLRRPARHRASREARRHRRRADADPGLLRRPQPGREEARQLLGLQHHQLFLARAALHLARRRHARVQGAGAAAARGRHRGHPRRRLQPHRRGQPSRPDALLPRHRQRQLLHARRRPALLFRHDRHRQHRQPPPSARAADGDGFAPLLGGGVPRRRLPLRPRLVARPRIRQLRPERGLLRRRAPGSGAVARKDDRRALGRRPERLPGRQLPARLGGVERPLPRRHAHLLEGRRETPAGVRARHARLGRPLRAAGPEALGERQLHHRA